MKYLLSIPKIEKDYLYSLLKERGVNDVKSFLNPKKEHCYDPELFDNIQEGVDLLFSHIERQSKICIVVDCDVDGYTSAAILWSYLKESFPSINLFFEVHEGKQHGLEDLIDEIEKYDFIILPDASSNDYDYHKKLSDKGIDILVLDHHLADSYSEDAIVINNQLSNLYPNKDLTGAGVVLKFCEYLDKSFNFKNSEKYYDLAALGQISDMSPVTGLETRYIIRKGLKQIKNSFLEAMIQRQAYSLGDIEKLTPLGIAFYITPLINALIRVGSLEDKRKLFEAFINGEKVVPSTKRGAKGEKETLSTQMVRVCANSKARQDRTKEKTMVELEVKIFNNNLDKNQVIFVEVGEDDEVDSNLTGLVAMQIAAKMKKPTLLGRKNKEGYIRGSIRANGKSEMKDFKAFLDESNLFEYVAGHANAAGFSIHHKNLEKFISYANEKLENVDFNVGVYEVDFLKQGHDTSIAALIKDLSQYNEIWGQENEEPLIAVENLSFNKQEIIVMGKNKDTVKIEKNDVSYIIFKASAFLEATEHIEDISADFIGKPNLNEWGGKTTPQLFVSDFNIRDGKFDF